MSDISVSAGAISEMVREKIAAEVIKVLDSEERSIILGKAVSDTLAGYKVRKVVEEAIGEVASELAREFLSQEEVRADILEKIKTSFEEAMEVIQEAALRTLMESFEVGGYSGDTKLAFKVSEVRREREKK